MRSASTANADIANSVYGSGTDRFTHGLDSDRQWNIRSAFAEGSEFIQCENNPDAG